MSGSQPNDKPEDVPDFSSLADQVEDTSPPWQITANIDAPKSDAALPYTTETNLDRSEILEAEQHIRSGYLFLGGGLALTCVSVLFVASGALVFTGAIGYGVYRLKQGYSLKKKLQSKKFSEQPAEALFRVRSETPNEQAAIHALHVEAFGQEDEARLVNELRAEGFATLSLVAVAGVRVIGHVLFSPIEIVSPSQTVRAMALAPVAVLPAWQRHGIGTALIRQALKTLAESGERIVIVLGDPNYYSRFGFRPELAMALQSPYAGEHFMALELSPGALGGVTGEVRYAAPFGRLG